MHSFIHPLQAAVPPCWESRSDWDIFEALARKVGELVEGPPARAGARPGGEPARARHPCRDGPARGARLGPRRVRRRSRGRPCPAWRWSARLRPPPRAVHLARPAGARSSASPPTASPGRSRTSTTSSLRDRPTVEWGGARYPSIARARDAANVILHLAPETNGEVGLARLPGGGGEGRAAARRPRRARTAACGSSFADLARQPRRLLDSPCWTGPHRRRPHLLGLLPQRGAARPLADAHRPAAPLPRPPRLPRLRRGAAHLQAEARPGAARATWPRRPGSGPVADARLPHAAREVEHPLDLRRQPADAHALARHPPALAERPRRGRDRRRATTTGSRW